jgi:hypothetical protein
VLRTQFHAPSQRRAVLAALSGAPLPAPVGAAVTLRVTGLAVAEYEFPSGQEPTKDFYLSPAFAAAHPGVPALQVYYVRLRRGAADLGRFEERNDVLRGAGVQDLDRPATAIATSIRPQATGWWVLAGLAALAGLAVAGQALARQAAAEDTDDPVLAALGVRPAQLAGARLARSLVVGAVGAVAGAFLAVALSAVHPGRGGPAGRPVSGPDRRLAGAAPGCCSPSWPPRRRRGAALRRPGPGRPRLGPVHRPSAVVNALARSRRAARRGDRHPAGAAAQPHGRAGRWPARGRTVPVGTALAGTVTAVAALCATAVFGASLTHLTASPALYGAPFQLLFPTSGPGGPTEAGLLAEFRRDPALARITLGRDPSLTVNGVSVRSLATAAIRGPVLLSTAAGRLPAGDREIALARPRCGRPARIWRHRPGHADLARAVRRTVPFTVTGVVLFASDPEHRRARHRRRAHAGLLHDAALCPPAPGAAACRRAAEQGLGSVILLRAADGPYRRGGAGPAHPPPPNDAYRTTIPTALVSFGESANFPLLLGAIIVLCGAPTLAHLLAVSVRRRRRENGRAARLRPPPFTRSRSGGQHSRWWAAGRAAPVAGHASAGVRREPGRSGSWPPAGVTRFGAGAGGGQPSAGSWGAGPRRPARLGRSSANPCWRGVHAREPAAWSSGRELAGPRAPPALPRPSSGACGQQPDAAVRASPPWPAGPGRRRLRPCQESGSAEPLLGE